MADLGNYDAWKLATPPESEEDECIADDSTECECRRCRAAEENWERIQGWHDDGRDNQDEDDDDIGF